AKGASLNASLLVERTKRKPTESYLFTGRDADQHDLDSIYAVGTNAFLQLCTLNDVFREFEGPLFSDSSRQTDRTLLPMSQTAELDAVIARFLPLLGPYLIEAPTGRALEWLVRRFRIHEFNVESILALFLPYHESPHFAKMLSILHIKPNSTWIFLLPFKAAAQNIQRPALVTEMLKNADATHFVVNLLPSALKGGYSHHTLLAFNAATVHDYLKRAKSLDEGTLALLLSAFLEPLSSKFEAPRDAVLGSYILIAALTQVCQLTATALKTTIGAMAGCAKRVSTRQFVNTLVAVCEAQEQLDSFTDGTAKNVLRLPNIAQELRIAEKYAGAESLYAPLLTSACKHIEDEALPPFLEYIIGSPTALVGVIKHLTAVLLRAAVSEDDILATNNTLLGSILPKIKQIHPECFEQVVAELSTAQPDLQATLNEFVVSLAISGPLARLATSEGTSVVASMNSDEHARAAGVKELLKSARQNLTESVRDALIARVQDTSVIVLTALYSDPVSLLPIFLHEPKRYIDGLSLSFGSGQKIRRHILRLHLGFLATHFCAKATSESKEDVFHQIIFPFLLFSKTRQHTAELVWEVISQNPAIRHELLIGCVTNMDGDDSNKMAHINDSTRRRIAENILNSDRYATHLSALVRKAHDADPNVRVLALLIMRALLEQLSGERLLDAASQAFEAVNLQQLPDVDASLLGSQGLIQYLSQAVIGKMVVHKLTSKTTTSWLQISILAFVASVPKQAGRVPDWFGPSDPHVQLQRSVYRIANSTAATPLLSIGLLSELFATLKDDSLAFLSGLWTMAENNNESWICLLALRHAAAFLQAHSEESDAVDFQTILPALVVCLSSKTRQVREAASECIALLQRMANEAKFSAVYAFDAIYGTTEASLQYVSAAELGRYLNALTDHREHIALDFHSIKVLHAQHLTRAKSDAKKDAEYKQHILCYLLSHVVAVPLTSMRVVLLEVLQNVSDASKSTVLTPLISAASHGSLEERLASLVIASFDTSTVSILNDVKNKTWIDVFVPLLEYCFKSASPSSCRQVLLGNLEKLVSQLTLERKVALCEVVLTAGVKDADMYLSAKTLVATALSDIAVSMHLLGNIRPDASSSPRASKRAKLSEVPDDSFARLSLLAEVLADMALPGSLDLVSRLLETLHHVVQSNAPADVDVSYIEQSLMSAIERSAEKIATLSSSIHLDILVELIRVADNPQTSNQALLLMATLARLAPESALQNVMPVFTFMGSNVFHRDDSYSFKVVQKTIDSIVPVMVASLKKSQPSRLELYIAARDFVRVFTDASNHIPRHRRTHFFGHLTSVLGVSDFLPPLCMLLVEKLGARVIRQNHDELQNTLALPISVIHRQPVELQIFVRTLILSKVWFLTAFRFSRKCSENHRDYSHERPIPRISSRVCWIPLREPVYIGRCHVSR
ncbi:unnamed protein product, partial [Mycena citricolor]